MNEAEKLINSLYGKGTIGFTCDSCGRETNGITYVNGMKFLYFEPSNTIHKSGSSSIYH